MNFHSYGSCARCSEITIALVAVAACGGSVVSDPEQTEAPPAAPDCVATGTEGATAPWLEPTNVKSAAFIEGRLHLQAELSGEELYLILALESDTSARVVATSASLRGAASFVEVGNGLWARVHVDPGGGSHVQVMDASDADSPRLVARAVIDGFVDPPDAFSVSDERVFFCVRETETALSTFFEVDLRDPLAPTPPASLNVTCDQYAPATFMTEGSTWFVYNHPTGSGVQQVTGYHVGSDGVKGTVQYGYNQTGVHAYGDVLRADTSSSRAVADPENGSLFLIADTDNSSSPRFAWATFSVSSRRQLLGVVDKTVYLTTAEGVRAYDIADLDAPVLTQYEAQVQFTDDAPRLLAATNQLLLIADGPATLYVAPRDDPGALAPLRIYDSAGAPPLPACP